MAKTKALSLILLTLTWLIFFSRTLFAGKVYFLDDLKIIYYPLEHVYAQFQSMRQLPVWSELFGFGHPLLAWGQLGFFTPVHVILRLFGLHPLILLQASILIYFALGLAGMYWFLLRRKLHPLAASLGAIVYVFSGFNVGHLNHVNFYVATMVLPWLLVAIDRFIERPTLRRAGIMALVAAIIPLSGQPQISLYSLIIAAIYGLTIAANRRWRQADTRRLLKLTTLTILAGVLAVSLASMAILPLMEFLPMTERANDLSTSELYEFSYPPNHVITLLRPYFFGDHANYWGAKNFQELSAYTGLLPLLLAFIAFISRKNHRTEKITGLIFIALALVIAPGVHSPIYRLLVEQHIVTSLTIPGRFVFFFDTGIAILAAIGLHQLIIRLNKNKKKAYIIASVTVIVAAGNLVYYGWNFNPLQDRQTALAVSPLIEPLQKYANAHSSPPRLYSATSLPLGGASQSVQRATDSISPIFQIHQPFTLQADVRCLNFPYQIDDTDTGSVTLSLNQQIGGPTLYANTYSAKQLAQISQKGFCLPPEIVSARDRELIFSATSDHPSGIKLIYLPSPEPSVYFVRVANPTAEQITQSQKLGRLVLIQEQVSSGDQDNALLIRHIQATANTSSVRWVGALSISSYRTFIDELFANDREPFNGEGVHALVHNRSLLNMAGITHLAHAVTDDQSTDALINNGYQLITQSKLGPEIIRLYENPDAFPKAFLVPNAIFEPDAGVTRHRLTQANYNPNQLIYINGPKPPAEMPALRQSPSAGTATITNYQPTQVDISVKSSEDSWLVLTDTWTPQWQTFIDDIPQPQFFANTTWRTTHVPAGNHTVSFRYHSPATELAKKLSLASLLVIIMLMTLPALLHLTTHGKVKK